MFVENDSNIIVLALIRSQLPDSLSGILPTFGGTNFPIFVQIIFFGLIGIIAILGLTGKRGKVGFVFVLLADLVYLAYVLFKGEEKAFIQLAVVNNIATNFGEYIMYGVYGLILLAAVFFAVGLATGREDYELSGTASILPVLYMLVVFAGYVALALLPKLIDFSFSAALVHYSILGAIGLPVLMTLIGVHSKTFSRSNNGWLIVAALAAIALINAAEIVLGKILVAKNSNLDVYCDQIVDALTPIIAVFGVAGFAAADLRN